ncbi:hypothetical protein HETIRDRAFT_107384 [Heterobasidion irregulare TC 32-1]|uniref:Uncharacterized protein n=1 Tax=Heterobasidion irregulare (strain TC 32-1) TaxID=747525 RepID=W4JW60_HETIT|nr:uncharacterized protein HETIRDRAFT_107384 [Heterobasidion irregulare TC 32-1]ETW77714.1 hypothetical protein HETIRDRAFT_107384 [Heterobasidion irregulare TC 32-1]
MVFSDALKLERMGRKTAHKPIKASRTNRNRKTTPENSASAHQHISTSDTLQIDPTTQGPRTHASNRPANRSRTANPQNDQHQRNHQKAQDPRAPQDQRRRRRAQKRPGGTEHGELTKSTTQTAIVAPTNERQPPSSETRSTSNDPQKSKEQRAESRRAPADSSGRSRARQAPRPKDGTHTSAEPAPDDQMAANSKQEDLPTDPHAPATATPTPKRVGHARARAMGMTKTRTRTRDRHTRRDLGSDDARAIRDRRTLVASDSIRRYLPPTPTHPAPPRPQNAARPKGSEGSPPPASLETPTPPLAACPRAYLSREIQTPERLPSPARSAEDKQAKEGTARAKHRSPWDRTPRRTHARPQTHTRTGHGQMARCCNRAKHHEASQQRSKEGRTGDKTGARRNVDSDWGPLWERVRSRGTGCGSRVAGRGLSGGGGNIRKEGGGGERREWGAGARQTPAAASPVSGTQTTGPDSNQRATRAHATHSGAASTTGRGKPARSASHTIAIPERCEPKMSLRPSRAGVCVYARTRAVRIARGEPSRADPAPRMRTDANTIVADCASSHRPRRGYLASSYLVRARAALLLSGGPTAPHAARARRRQTGRTAAQRVAQYSTVQHRTNP